MTEDTRINYLDKPVAMNIKTFTQMFGVGRTTTYKLIAQKRLVKVRIGGRTLITMASAEALFECAVAASASEN